MAQEAGYCVNEKITKVKWEQLDVYSLIKRVAITAISLTAMLSLSSYACGADNTLTKEEEEGGWELLFNGEDLGHWRNFKKNSLSEKWVIDNGAMHLSAAGGGDIMTKKRYQNFELKLEWKISKAGNSGIFFLVSEEGKYIYSRAPEVQILDNERHSDNKVDSHLAGSVYGLVASHTRAHKPAGEWNQVVIRLQDRHLQVWQNGVSTASVVIGSSTWKTLVADSKFSTWEGFASAHDGHIGLQDHSDPVWFKNIKIRAL
ncbi:DUF1080 domain-containing protein [Alteromonas sediminis]|uniref:DUF1080 domain-containing protein n=1 Tax=Alteromonas sediminis TaxID=2259342 RepID=A0A3N5XZE2_9ALTE|nr:DUF1080 domain-containing protein [Alteromonas sediminis]RPJ66432.1 DUF1080 domain-containing protein [Alteromonas sediminis]